MRKIIFYGWMLPVVMACGGCGGSPGGTKNASDQSPNDSKAVLAQLCGVDVGSLAINGTVVNVHDGDTLTVSANGRRYTVRLDSLDAPEMDQSFGELSGADLRNKLLNQNVRVRYAKTDKYGRTVGAVFTDSCEYINLAQVRSGMAWFYKAYRCEISAGLRQKFAAAQQSARAGRKGLWAETKPVAPWVFRNAYDPVPPTCSSPLPDWAR
ncbi:MAG: thermonuclease family protein [Rhodoferax sp.]|nr:thermonuclease family protein [Rhodoferax sp.]